MANLYAVETKGTNTHDFGKYELWFRKPRYRMSPSGSIIITRGEFSTYGFRNFVDRKPKNSILIKRGK